MSNRVIGRASERRRKQRRTRRVPCKGAAVAFPPATMVSCVPSPTPEAQTTLDEPLASALSKRPPPVHTDAADVDQFVRAYEIATTSPTTRRLYLNRLTLFLAWCAAHRVSAIPASPEGLRLYLISLAAKQKSLSTIDVSVAAISMAHRALGHAVPMSDALRITLRALRKDLAQRCTPTTTISLAMLRQIVAACDHDPHGIRDRALILVMYFAGLRRAEAAGLNREGANREERGYRLTLDGEPRYDGEAPISLMRHADQTICPVLALDAWLLLPAMWVRGLDVAPARGAIFVGLHHGRRQRLRIGKRLAPYDVDRIVKRRAITAGFNPAGLSAASLRAGFHADAEHGDPSVIA